MHHSFFTVHAAGDSKVQGRPCTHDSTSELQNSMCSGCNLRSKLHTVSLVTQSCPTLCKPTDWSPPASSVHGISQARILEWVAISFSRGIFPTRGLNLCLLCLLHYKQILYLLSHREATENPQMKVLGYEADSWGSA